MAVLVIILLVVVIMVPLAILRGWVLSILWGWFLVPLGLINIGIAHAIGISMMVSMLTHENNDTKEEMSGSIVRGVVVPLIALLIGWIVHSFM